MADFRAIMSLVFKGHSYRQIVEGVGCSHRDVSAVRQMIADRGITAQRLAGMSDAELVGLFPDGRSGVSTGYDGPDFARVVASMRSNPHFTLLQAWRGYVGSVSDLRTYGYSQYCHRFGQYAARNDLVATLHHEPGRAMFVDWAGDTIGLVDVAGGKPAVAYLFVAVLPFSGCVHCPGVYRYAYRGVDHGAYRSVRDVRRCAADRRARSCVDGHASHKAGRCRPVRQRSVPADGRSLRNSDRPGAGAQAAGQGRG
jgi:hypothetical protein